MMAITDAPSRPTSSITVAAIAGRSPQCIMSRTSSTRYRADAESRPTLDTVMVSINLSDVAYT